MKKNLSYIDSVHWDGRIWNIAVMLLLMAFPVSVAILFDTAPDWGALGLGLVATAPMYWAVGAIETVTFVVVDDFLADVPALVIGRSTSVNFGIEVEFSEKSIATFFTYITIRRFNIRIAPFSRNCFKIAYYLVVKVNTCPLSRSSTCSKSFVGITGVTKHVDCIEVAQAAKHFNLAFVFL